MARELKIGRSYGQSADDDRSFALAAQNGRLRSVPFRNLAAFLSRRSHAGAAFRKIASRLLAEAPPGMAPRILTVTCARSGEGTTTTVANLALALARGGVNVLVVDAALRKPSLHRLLDVRENPGLCQILEGRAELDDVVQATQFPGLNVLAAGGASQNSSDLLNRNNLDSLIAALRQRLEPYVLIDSPALLTAPESAEIANRADAVAAVVRIGSSPKEVVMRALEELHGSNFIGLIVNDVWSSSVS